MAPARIVLLVALVAASASALVVSSAAAVEIAPTSQSRSLFEEYWDPDGNRHPTTLAAPDFQDFTADFGSAAHHVSSIGTDAITGDLFARGRGQAVGTSEEHWNYMSSFQADFTLGEATSYQLDGVIDVDSSDNLVVNVGSLALSFFDTGLGSFVPVASWGFSFEDGLSPVSAAGVLAPGSYRLAAMAYAEGFYTMDRGEVTSHADVDFSFSLVPEPSTGLLCAGFLAGAVATRRRSASRDTGSAPTR